jgi:hypothetical protein
MERDQLEVYEAGREERARHEVQPIRSCKAPIGRRWLLFEPGWDREPDPRGRQGDQRQHGGDKQDGIAGLEGPSAEEHQRDHEGTKCPPAMVQRRVHPVDPSPAVLPGRVGEHRLDNRLRIPRPTPWRTINTVAICH